MHVHIKESYLCLLLRLAQMLNIALLTKEQESEFSKPGPCKSIQHLNVKILIE